MCIRDSNIIARSHGNAIRQNVIKLQTSPGLPCAFAASGWQWPACFEAQGRKTADVRCRSGRKDGRPLSARTRPGLIFAPVFLAAFFVQPFLSGALWELVCGT